MNCSDFCGVCLELLGFLRIFAEFSDLRAYGTAGAAGSVWVVLGIVSVPEMPWRRQPARRCGAACVWLCVSLVCVVWKRIFLILKLAGSPNPLGKEPYPHQPTNPLIQVHALQPSVRIRPGEIVLVAIFTSASPVPSEYALPAQNNNNAPAHTNNSDLFPYASTATLDHCTLCIVKPHAMRSRAFGAILDSIIARGFEVTAVREMRMSKVQAEEFLEVRSHARLLCLCCVW